MKTKPKDKKHVPAADGGTFNRLARQASKIAGHSVAFSLAAGMILIWAITGPIFGFSDTWQLVINTTTTIITFLMVFLIQSSQNRDSEAVQLKLDELIRATKAAQNALLGIEDLTEEELDELKTRYQDLAKQARATKSAIEKKDQHDAGS
jgi:low affinity Fe/Cu permease